MFVKVSIELRKKWHIYKKAWKNKNKQRQNVIAQVKRWFSTRLKTIDRFRCFPTKIANAASITPISFFSIMPISLFLQVKIC